MAGRTGRKVLLIVTVVIAAVIFAASVLPGIIGGAGGGKIVRGDRRDHRRSQEVMADMARFKETTASAVSWFDQSPGGAVGPRRGGDGAQEAQGGQEGLCLDGAVCAWGGYYIASVGEKLYANPRPSPGPSGHHAADRRGKLMKKIGVQSNTLKAGPEGRGQSFRKMTDSERQYLQSIIDNIHEQFIKDVAAGRKMPLDKTRTLADGRIYTGLQAKEAGLIDGIGTFYDVVDEMKKAVGIKGKPELVYGKRPFAPLRWLFSSMAREMLGREQAEPFQYKYTP